MLHMTQIEPLEIKLLHNCTYENRCYSELLDVITQELYKYNKTAIIDYIFSYSKQNI